MSLTKTAKGHAALARRGLLSRRERQLLILCDARRTLHDLQAMMGLEIEADVWRLHAQGLLASPTLAMRRETGVALDFALTLPPSASGAHPALPSTRGRPYQLA